MGDAEQRERIEQLINALRDENEALRNHAVASLGQMGIEALPES
jgi:HEAT repeat protein